MGKIAKIPRSCSISHLKMEESGGKEIEEPYGKKIDIYLQKAKAKQNSGVKLVEQRNEERLNKLINSNKRLAKKLGGGENEFIPFNIQKSKLFGDEYLKESLLKGKRNFDTNLTESNSDNLQESMELKAHEKHISPN